MKAIGVTIEKLAALSESRAQQERAQFDPAHFDDWCKWRFRLLSSVLALVAYGFLFERNITKSIHLLDPSLRHSLCTLLALLPYCSPADQTNWPLFSEHFSKWVSIVTTSRDGKRYMLISFTPPAPSFRKYCNLLICFRRQDLSQSSYSSTFIHFVRNPYFICKTGISTKACLT